MIFLDPKEQVIDIQLTQHGKRLLSQGLLEPVYYAFYDDDISYDALSNSVSESQNNVLDRIKSSPQLESHYNFNGIETNFKKFKKIKISNDDAYMKSFLNMKEEENYLAYSLGDSISETNNLSAYNVTFLNGGISGSVAYLSSSAFPHVRIPQLNSDITFNIYVGSKYEETFLNSRDSFDEMVYDDGSYIAIDEDYLLLEIDEENTTFLDENFDIEVFRVEKDINDSNKQFLIPLDFMTVKEKRKDIFVVEKDLKNNNLLLDENDVEYYFDILVDNEIDEEIFCKAKKGLKVKNIYAKIDIKCPEKSLEKNIYRESDDNIEVCD